MRVAVIGQGLFGSIIADTLKRDGHQVQVADANIPGAGSKPAACLMKPGWLSKVPRLSECLGLLHELYGVEDLSFRVNGLMNATVHWVDPAKILRPLSQHMMIEAVNGTTVTTHRGESATYDRVIVAAGVWTKTLCPWVPVEPRWGAAMLWPSHKDSVVPSSITQWAPYRQMVVFQRGDGLWGGDGSALKTWDSEKELTVKRRIQDHLDIHDEPKVLVGARPYVKTTTPGDPCWLEFQPSGLVVATGGAKNGTAAAAYCALRIREEFRK